MRALYNLLRGGCSTGRCQARATQVPVRGKQTQPKRERKPTTDCKHTLIILLHPNCDIVIPLAHRGTFCRPAVPALRPAPLDTRMRARFWLQNVSQVRRENWFHYMIAVSAVLLATGMD